jgi:hypothetical protein
MEGARRSALCVSHVAQDNGHGMTPLEGREFYLKVGRDRREHSEQGGASRVKKRSVMGREGIRKLAAFGICRTIEVLSSGGDELTHLRGEQVRTPTR